MKEELFIGGHGQRERIKKHFPAGFWAVRAHLCREKIEDRNGSSLFLHGRRQLNCRARMEGESVSDGYGIIMPVSSFPMCGVVKTR